MFVAGFGCGFYVRDRILKKRRPPYLFQPEYRQEAPSRLYPEISCNQEIPAPLPEEPNRIQAVTTPQSPKPNNNQYVAALTLLDFNTVRMSDELQALLELLPREGRTKSL